MTVMTYMHAGAGRKLVGFLTRPRPQYWLARLQLSCWVMLSTSYAWFLPVSAQRTTLDGIGMEAWAVLFCVSGMAFLCFVDSLLNDVMPDRFHLRWADRHRHQLYMTLAILLWLLVWMNGTHNPNPLLLAGYGLQGSFCVIIAIFDTVARYKQVQRVKAGE